MRANLAYQEAAYREEGREEIISGKITLMAPASVNHTRIIRNISRIFDNYLQGRTCEYFPDGVGVYLSADEMYIPDGMIVCDPEKIRRKGIVGAPDLVIEVLSRATAKNDKGHKKDVYERCGVREYWIVDPIRLGVEQYLLENGRFVLRDVYHKYPPSVLADMSEDEQAAIVSEFQCSLFDDLTIRLDDVFGRVVI